MSSLSWVRACPTQASFNVWAVRHLLSGSHPFHWAAVASCPRGRRRLHPTLPRLPSSRLITRLLVPGQTLSTPLFASHLRCSSSDALRAACNIHQPQLEEETRQPSWLGDVVDSVLHAADRHVQDRYDTGSAADFFGELPSRVLEGRRGQQNPGRDATLRAGHRKGVDDQPGTVDVEQWRGGTDRSSVPATKGGVTTQKKGGALK